MEGDKRAHSLPELGAVAPISRTLLVRSVTNKHHSRSGAVDGSTTAGVEWHGGTVAANNEPHGALPPGRQPECSSDVEVHHGRCGLQKTCWVLPWLGRLHMQERLDTT